MKLIDIWLSGVGGYQLIWTLNRVLVGFFFISSGYHKMFVPARHAALVTTLKSCGIPCIKYMQWFVPGVELFGGLGVAFGFLTVLAAIGLMGILAVATCTDGLKRIPAWGPVDEVDYADCVLYLPEVLLMLLLLPIIATGSGPLSIDHFLMWALGF